MWKCKTSASYTLASPTGAAEICRIQNVLQKPIVIDYHGKGEYCFTQ